MGTQAAARSRRTLAIAVAAALGALAVAGATAGFVLGGSDSPPQAAASAPPKNAGCAEVSKQYTWWSEQTRAVVGLPDLAPAQAKARTEEVAAAGAALRAVLQRYPDASVRALASAVTAHDVELGLLGADIDLGAEVDTLALGDVLLAQQAAGDAYTAFLRASC